MGCTRRHFVSTHSRHTRNAQWNNRACMHTCVVCRLLVVTCPLQIDNDTFRSRLSQLTGKMSVLMISEWMAATPLTAKEPTTAR